MCRCPPSLARRAVMGGPTLCTARVGGGVVGASLARRAGITAAVGVTAARSASEGTMCRCPPSLARRAVMGGLSLCTTRVGGGVVLSGARKPRSAEFNRSRPAGRPERVDWALLYYGDVIDL